MKKNTLRRAALFMLPLLYPFMLGAQEKPRSAFFIGIGGTAHSYFHEGTLGVLGHNPGYLSSTIISPTLSLGYRSERLRSELEASTYFNFVPATDTLRDLLYVKRNYTFSYFFLINNLRIGVSYVMNNSRHQIRVPSMSGEFTFEDGIGFSAGYEFDNYVFDLRKEIFFGFGPYVTYISPIVENWTFRVARQFHFSKNDRQNEKGNFQFTFTFGGLANLNPIAEIFPAQPQVKTSFLYGLEMGWQQAAISVYAWRSAWFPIEPFNFAFKINAQATNIGIAKTMGKSGILEKLTVGVHHTWLLERSLLYLDFLEKGYDVSVLPNNYQNKAAGLSLRYEIFLKVHALCMFDLYYKAHSLLGTGFNDESLKLGITYSIN